MVRWAMAGLIACGMAGAARAGDMPSPPVPLEQRVLDELNRIRTDPRAYAQDLRAFRTLFDGTFLRVPGMRYQIRTTEGTAAVDEAVAFAEQRDGAEPLEHSALLALAAADHAAYLAGGADSHFGSDGSGPWDRVRRRGGGPNVGEIISFGFDDSREVARQFIVDDGVPDRGHRRAMFDASYRYAGVACGPHPRFRALCVVELSRSPDGH